MSLPSEDHVLSGAQAAQDISSVMIRAAGDALGTHGNDPNSPAVLSAAFVLAINNITAAIDPTFKRRLLMQLQAK